MRSFITFLLAGMLATSSLTWAQYVDIDRPFSDYSHTEGDALESKPDSKYTLWISTVLVKAHRDYTQEFHEDVVNAWFVVAEDFKFYDVNVTTSRAVFDATDKDKRMEYRLIANWSGGQCGEGVFGNEWKWCHGSVDPNTISHEFGHSLTAIHQSGEGSPLEIAGIKAQIMAWHDYSLYSTWDDGFTFPGNDATDVDYSFKINNIDQMKAFLAIRPDDYGNTDATATALNIEPTGEVRREENNGIIETDGDLDVFAFATNGGAVDLHVHPLKYHNNLHADAEIVDAGGNVVIDGIAEYHFTMAEAEAKMAGRYPSMPNTVDDYQSGELKQIKQGVHLAGNLPAGTYYLRVTNTGYDDGNGNGYLSYFSRGYFDIHGTIESVVDGCDLPATVAIQEQGTNETGPFELCPGGEVQIETSIDGSGSFEYQLFHNGVNTTSNISGEFTLNEEGTYHVMLVDQTNTICKKKSNDLVMETNTLEDPNFTQSTVDICQGTFGVTYSIESVSDVTYDWSYDGVGATINGSGNSVTISFADDATSGTLTAEISNSCGNASAGLAIGVRDCSPNIVASYMLDQSTVCSGETVTFTNTSTGVSGSETYDWDFGAGANPATANGEGPHTVTYDALGNASVSLIVSENGNSNDTLRADIITIEDCREVVASFSADQTALCSGETIIFTNTSTGVSGSETYNWDFGAGATPATASGPGPYIVTYAGSGSVSVSLSVVDGVHSDDTLRTDLIEINEVPVVSVLGNIGVCELTSGAFYTANSSLANSSFTWTVNGNGSLVSGQGTDAILVDFTTEGISTISVVETSDKNCEGEEASLNVNINDCSVVEAGYSVDQQEICSGESVVFTNISTGTSDAAVYAWDFGVGATPAIATGEGPHTVQYDGDMPATIQLTVTDGAQSDQFIAGYQVIVNALPELTSLGDLSGCDGVGSIALAGHVTPLGGTYSGTHVNADSYDGSTVNSSTVTYDYTGAHNCSASEVFDVTIHANPIVEASDVEVCELEGQLDLTTGTPLGGSYAGEGVTGTMYDLSAGTRSLLYTYEDANGCSASDNLTVTVLESVDPFVGLMPLQDFYCEGEEVVATVDGSTLTGDLSGTTYSWLVNGAADGSNGTQTYTSSSLSDGNSIQVVMTLPDNDCLTSSTYVSEEVLVHLEQAIIPVITAMDTILCANTSESVSLQVTDLNGGTGGWSWALDGTSFGNGNVINASEGGIYAVTGTGGNCGSETATQELVVLDLSVTLRVNDRDLDNTTVNVDDELLLEAFSSNGVAFGWSINNDPILEDGNQLSLGFPFSSIVQVNVSLDGCESTDSISVLVNSILSVSPLVSMNANGVNDVWEIEGLEGYSAHSIHVMNKWGTQVFHTDDYLNNPWLGENLNSGALLPAGTYYYTIELVTLEGETKNMAGFVTLMK